MFSFRYTSSVCKHKKTVLSYRMGQNYAPNSCSYLHQMQMDFTDFIFHTVV